MLIRKIKKLDAQAVAILLGQLGYPTNSPSFLKRLEKLNGKLNLILVAIENKKFAGFISLHLIPLVHEDGYLSRVTALVVDKSFRKKGIGKLLLQKAETYALKHGAVRSEITSGEKRIGAHRFYANFGYQEYRKRFIKKLIKNK